MTKVRLFLPIIAAVLMTSAANAQNPSSVLGVSCSSLAEHRIDKQMNLRAAAIRKGCGLEPGEAPFRGKLTNPPPLLAPANVNTITGTETSPNITQSESMVWTSDGNTIVVHMNDSRSSASGQYSGVSVSTNGGATFTRLNPSPFATGHGLNFGDPNVIYNAKLAKWFAADLVSLTSGAGACGAQGIGLWTSTDGLTWSVGACAHVGSDDDRNSMWVDNTPASPFYGRMYVSWNDFSTANANLVVARSDDGVTWTPVTVFSTGFRRNAQITGASDGTVFAASMNEGTGGVSNRVNYIHRSTDGGVTWTTIVMGAAFLGPGDSTCSGNAYFAKITQYGAIWDMGSRESGRR